MINKYHTRHCSVDEIQNTKKMNTRESKERKFEKKIKRNRVSCFNIYLVVFTFLSRTAEKGRCKKLNEMFVFGILFICYV